MKYETFNGNVEKVAINLLDKACIKPLNLQPQTNGKDQAMNAPTQPLKSSVDGEPKQSSEPKLNGSSHNGTVETKQE